MSSHHVQTSYVKGEGYGPFLLVALSFWKSTKKFNFLFFLGTTTIGESQGPCKRSLCSLSNSSTF